MSNLAAASEESFKMAMITDEELAQIDQELPRILGGKPVKLDLSSSYVRDLIQLRLELAKVQAMREIGAQLEQVNAWLASLAGEY